MAADLGKASAGPGERAPRPRGAHAAAKSGGLFQAPARTAPHRTPARAAAHQVAAAASTPARATAASTPARATAASLCAAALVAVVVPLAVLQIPDAIAWSVPAPFATAGPNALASLMRAADLALPAMAAAAPFGALAIRRFRAGPVLLAGLLAIGAADVFGQTARGVLLIGVDRSLHGLGGGISMAAIVAIVAEQRRAARSLAAWWACLTVCALAAAPDLVRHRVITGGWRAALQPYPWLAGAALALAALYAILAEGMGRSAMRSAFPAAERALLALLAAPVAGICTIAVAVTYRGHHAVVAAAIAAVMALVGLAVIAVRASTAGGLAAVCVVTGFTLAPTASAATALAPPTQLGSQVGFAAIAAAACGAALGLTRRETRAAVAVGLFLAAAALGAAGLAGPDLTQVWVLALLCVPLAGGLAAALGGALRGVGTGGALCGVVLLLAGVVGGHLAAGAVQLQALQDARTAAAMHAALVSTTARWALTAAVIAAAVALATALAPGLHRNAPRLRRNAPRLRSDAPGRRSAAALVRSVAKR